MFERFSDDARKTVVLAQEEARSLAQSQIGTEHLLLGLLRRRESVAASVLSTFGVTLPDARSQVAELQGSEGPAVSSHMPFTPEAKDALQRALQACTEHGAQDVNTEHVLFGVLETGGRAVEVLRSMGVDADELQRTLTDMLDAEAVPERSAGIAAAGTFGILRGDPPAMDGTITLRGLQVFAHHGVLPEEQEAGQTFIIDVTMHLDLRPAAETDDLSATVDYGLMAQAIHDRVAGERWDLIERVAGRVADLVMEDTRVDALEVTVHKPGAPIEVPFDDVSVTIRRTR